MMPPGVAAGSAAAALLRALWAGSLPATLQGADERLIDVNEAFAQALGRSAEGLRGSDPAELQPESDREAQRQAQRSARPPAPTPSRPRGAAPVAPEPEGDVHRRLVDAQGREHWFALTRCNLAAPGARALWLTLWHDLGPEQAARAQAQRAEDELARWFELSPDGMLVYDHTGLVLRSNAAFESLVQRVPEVLDEAGPELQALLAWEPGGLSAALVPGARPLERQAQVPLAAGRRRLWARLACLGGAGADRRVLAVVQDRSNEDARDLAQLEMGMLMDAAGIGVATYDPEHGWLAPPAGAGALPAGAAATEVALTGIRRDLVEADSMAEFDQLQQALRQGLAREVRYAVSHPSTGRRWLQTRVLPGQWSDGRSTTSVVTLDVTEQETARRRNDQLLHEMTTILDGTTAGIAYLRGPVLVRCNRRFELILGFAPGAAAGASLAEIIGRGLEPPQAVGEAMAALEQGRSHETELSLAGHDGVVRWYSLSVRRAGTEAAQREAVAVLTDITRLKDQQAELERLARDRELMFNVAEVGIVYQRGARIERANPAMATLTGWSPSELTTIDPAELFENARACVDFEARVAQALREHGRYSGEWRLRHRGGPLRWVQVGVRPVDRDDAGGGIICSFVDIEERRQARESLALQAERTRAMLNSVLVGIVTVSAAGIGWMNRSARRMFAGELADFVGEPISTVATPEADHPLRRQDWLQRLQPGQSETFECRLRARDGREFWVVGNAVLGAPAVDGEAAAPELTFALLDIERRRQAEVSIAQAQASLQRVIETAPLAIALFDARSLRVQQLNQTAAAFFGRPLAELTGQEPQACCAPALARTLPAWLRAAAGNAGTVHTHEWRDEDAEAVDQGGEHRVWDCRITTLDATGGEAPQLLMVASDVTEQRAAERARLQAAIAQREVLVREVHHRIKNNLQGVAGLLQQNAARHPEVSDVLSEAVGQVQAIAQVYGLQVGASGPLELAGLLRAVAASLQRTFGRTVTVLAEPEVPHQLPEAEAIPVALTLNELLTNAIKHGRSGEVRCRLTAAGEVLTLEIAGEGALPVGFDLAQVRGGVSGLGLVRALLPRRSASFSLAQQGADVVATVVLRPPGVRLPGAGDRRQSTP